MKRCAFLTLAEVGDYVIDDELAVPALQERGWSVDSVPWTARAEWQRYDLVVIRSTWDYQYDAARFLRVLDDIAQAGVRIENALDTVRWNTRKTYLRELEQRGVPIVPTSWQEGLTADVLRALFGELQAEELVVKPQVGANAGDTLRVRRDDAGAQEEALRLFPHRACMVQPFLQSITDEGEYSLILFDGELSHTILKTPKRGDFRVQEEHGGIITAVTAPPALVEQATRAVHAIAPLPLYARADFARIDGDRFGVMELELIEPSLYFRMDERAPQRFAGALDRRMRLAGAT